MILKNHLTNVKKRSMLMCNGKRFLDTFGGNMIKINKCFIFVVILIGFQFIFTGCNISSANTPSGNTVPITKYDLFETQNMWTFILLDTVTGRMWQIQYDVQGDNRGGVELNTQDLADGKQIIPGRFTLHKTANMYNFILLDQIDGSTWQVQWSMEKNNRGILPIFQ
jgi:hypothetical protein